MEEFWEYQGRENALSAIMGCLVSHQDKEEKNANDEVHDKKEETGREGSETTINIVTNRWRNVVLLLSGRIHPPSSLSASLTHPHSIPTKGEYWRIVSGCVWCKCMHHSS